MALDLSEDSSPPKKQAIKVTGVTFVITSLANKIKDPTAKDWILSLSPIIGYVVNVTYNILAVEASNMYFSWRVQRVISELKKQKSTFDCTITKTREIDKKITVLESAIDKKKIKDLNIKL